MVLLKDIETGDICSFCNSILIVILHEELQVIDAIDVTIAPLITNEQSNGLFW